MLVTASRSDAMECGFANELDWSGWKAEVPPAADSLFKREKKKKKHTGGLNCLLPGWIVVRSHDEEAFARHGEPFAMMETIFEHKLKMLITISRKWSTPQVLAYAPMSLIGWKRLSWSLSLG